MRHQRAVLSVAPQRYADLFGERWDADQLPLPDAMRGSQTVFGQGFEEDMVSIRAARVIIARVASNRRKKKSNKK